MARRQFAEKGFDQTSLRAIARDAGVDAALVTHFFGSKEGLFRATIEWPVDPDDLARRIIGSGPRGMSRRLTRAFLELWEDPPTRTPLLAVIRRAATQEESARLVREFLHERVYRQLAVALGGGEDAALRIDFAMSQLIGLAVLRHVLRIEPIASLPLDEVVEQLTPVVTRHLRAR